MKIAFVCDLPQEHFLHWNDGLKAALGILSKDYQIEIFNQPTIEELKKVKCDIGLFWGAIDKPLHKFKIFKKQALLFAGGVTYHPYLHNFDVVFAESKVDFLEFKRFGKKVFQAFGTNTKLFVPIPTQPKIFDYVYLAAFAKWKHHEKFAKYVFEHEPDGNSIAIGYMQPDGWEKECYEICQSYSIAVVPQIPYEAVPWIMNASHNVYVGADAMGGCQRTVLEAISCDVPVIVDSDSPKLKELAKLTRLGVLRSWSEKAYANKLKEGLKSI